VVFWLFVSLTGVVATGGPTLYGLNCLGFGIGQDIHLFLIFAISDPEMEREFEAPNKDANLSFT